MSLDLSSTKATVYYTSGAGRKLSYPVEKEEELLQWVLEQCDLHLAVTVQNIIDQAVTQSTHHSNEHADGHRSS